MIKTTLSSSLGKLLLKNKQTLAVAESCTGGLLSHWITETPGSSNYFIGGIISYSNTVKHEQLGIDRAVIKKQGAVSPQVATLMAKNVRQLLKADYGIGITGIAGPDGGSKLKPVGLIYIAVAGKRKIFCKKFQFFGTRSEIKSRAAHKALDLLKLELLKTGKIKYSA